MPPELATHSRPVTRTAESSPPAPLPARPRLTVTRADLRREAADARPLVEWAVAELGAVPTAVGHCYRCGFAACMYSDRSRCARGADPRPFDRWLNWAVGATLIKVFGEGWDAHPFRDELSRVLGDRIAGRTY